MKLNVEAMLENEKVKAGIAKCEAALAADPMLDQMAGAARSIEEIYEVAKHFIKVEFKEFCQVFEDVMEFYSEPKAALADDLLDDVAGGAFSWSVFGKVSLCAAIGFLVAGPLGVVAGLAIATHEWVDGVKNS